MSKSSFVQTTFHGGEWSPFFQGRMDHPKYKTGMNVCRNGYPIEEGAWVRRPGSRLLGPTYKGLPAKIYPVAFETENPYEVEFTDGNIRVFNGNFFVLTPEITRVISVSAANPAVVTVQTPVPWNTGDEVQFIFDPVLTPGTIGQLLRQRTFKITVNPLTVPAAWSSLSTYSYGAVVTSSGSYYFSLVNGNLNNTPASSPAQWQLVSNLAITSFTLADSVSGANFDGSTIMMSGTAVINVVRLLRLATPYASGSWQDCRVVQSQDQGIVVNGANQPQMLEISPTAGAGTAAAKVTLTPVNFLDGPYLDPVSNSQATMSALSGVVTMTVAFAAWSATQSYVAGDYSALAGVSYQAIADSINQTPPNALYWQVVPAGTAVTGDPNAVVTGFQSTDVGRLVRLFSQPAAWDATVTYAAGNTVFYNGVSYQGVNPVKGLAPDVIPVGAAQLAWEILPTGAQWTWGNITAVTNSFTVTVQIRGVPLLYNIPVPIWRLGAYSSTTGWPSCGSFYEGRFWFGGTIRNRFDCSTTFGAGPDGSINFAPTAVDGTVGDSNGISYTLESKDLNEIDWFEPDHNGLLCGTAGGEWLISASQLSDPITPTSIQAKRVTKYGCANIEPRRTGIALLFVQKFTRRVMEMLADVFTGRYTAPHLTETAKHLTKDGIADLWYQEELAPLVWLRTLANKLVAATYRRVSSFTTEVPAFIGWHRHDLGTLRPVESIGVGSFAGGKLDTLYMVTNDPVKQLREVEVFTQMFDEDDSLYDAWFLDGALVPDDMYQDTAGFASLAVTFTGQPADFDVLAIISTVGETNYSFFDNLSDSSTTYRVLTGASIAATVSNVAAAINASGTSGTTYSSDVVVNPDYSAIAQGNTLVLKAKKVGAAGNAFYVVGTTIPISMPNSSLFQNIPGTITATFTGGGNSIQGQRFTGLFYLIGQTVTVFAGGLDLGDFTVDANGTIFVPYGTGVAPVPIEYTKPGAGAYAFTQAYVYNIFGLGLSLRNGGINFTNTYLTITPGPTSLRSTTSIQAFIPTLTGLSGQSDFGVTIDWAASPSLLFMEGGTNTGMRKFRMDTCAELSDPTWATIGVTAGPINPTWSSNQNGLMYLCPGSSNYGPVAVITESGLSAKSVTGVASGAGPSLAVPPNTGLLNPGMANPLSMCVMTSRADWVVSIGVSRHITLNLGDDLKTPGAFVSGNGLSGAYQGSSGTPWVLQYGLLGTASVAPAYSVDRDETIHSDGSLTLGGACISLAFIVEGNQGHFSAANIYVVTVMDGTAVTTVLNPDGSINSTSGLPPPPGAPTPANPITNFKFLGSIAPNQIDPTWTYFTFVGGAVVDQLDNNLIFIAETDAAVVTQQYLVKVSTTPYNKAWYPPCHNDGAQPPAVIVQTAFGVLWVVPLQNCSLHNDQPYQFQDQFNKGQCKNGLYALLSNTQTVNNSHISGLYVVDTTTGRYGVYNVPGVYYTAFGGQGTQCWDDTSNSIVFFGGYDASISGAIGRLNGSGSFASQWCQLFLGQDIVNPLNQLCGTQNAHFAGYTFSYRTVSGGFPCVVGVNYTSQGQLLRPALRDDTGVHMGLGFGKTRRANRFAIMLKNTQSLQVGVDFANTLFPVYFKDDGNKQLPPTVTYSGIWRDTIADGYDFDSMLSWQIVRPYPCSVVSYGGFLDTTDV